MKKLFYLLPVMLLVALGGSRLANAGTLAVPLEQQEKDQWCWNASARMVLKFLDPSFSSTQTQIAAWAIAGHNEWNYLAYDGNRTIQVQETLLGRTTTKNVTIKCRGVKEVLKHFGMVDSTLFRRPLTEDELMDEIDGGRPVVFNVGWYRNYVVRPPLARGTHSNRNGGHICVIAGFDGTTVDINDPWGPTGTVHGAFSIGYEDLYGGDAGTYRPHSGPHKWEWSLTVAKSLDVIFLIDSTGSMSDDIANIKSNVNTIIDNMADKFKDYRIAVVDYRDPVSAIPLGGLYRLHYDGTDAVCR